MLPQWNVILIYFLTVLTILLYVWHIYLVVLLSSFILHFEETFTSAGGAGESLEALGMLGGGGGGGGGLSLRGALMGGMLDLPADDDDAMMELAIALSLHEEQGQAPADLGNLHPGLQGLVGGLPGLHRLQGLSGQVLHSLQVLAAGGMPGNNAQANAQEVQQVRLPC